VSYEFAADNSFQYVPFVFTDMAYCRWGVGGLVIIVRNQQLLHYIVLMLCSHLDRFIES